MKSSDIEQRERRKLVGSTTTATTYHERAIAELGLEGQGNRFAVGTSVTGAARVPQYPAASGPWNDPVQVPIEPPLGYEINAQESVGEPFEIAASSVSPENAAEEATEVGHSASGAAAPSALLPLAAEGVNFIRGRRL
jgi:hypothetical protein